MGGSLKPLPDKALLGYLHNGITGGYDSGMNTHTTPNSPTTTFVWFENWTTDLYEIHAPNCACIQKKIKNMELDSSNIHKKEAASGKDVMLQIIEEWKSYDDDFNECESGDPVSKFKVFPCTKKVGN